MNEKPIIDSNADNPADLIQNRDDLRRFLESDLAARNLKRLPFLYQLRKPIVHYTVLLRKCEYYKNAKPTNYNKIMFRFFSWKHKMLGAKLGFSITPNVFGPGLYLVHWGSIVISSKAQIGCNAKVHSGVNVSGEPVMGRDVYFGPGSVVVGDIKVGDGAQLGANSVITKDVPARATILGNPGRVIKI